MREFPNAAARPWRFVVTPKTDSTEVWVELVANGGLVIGEPYYHGQAEYNDDPEANAALIVHAVNTYEERERLLDEAAEACRALIAWDDSDRKGPDYGSLTRATHPHGELIWKQWWDSQSALCERSFDTARAFLAKLEARDA